MKTRIIPILALTLLSTLNPPLSTLLAQGTAFTYQGRLNDGANPANGNHDFTFALFGASSGGVALAGPVTNSTVGLSNGLFTVTLDFGSQFPGADRWLEIGARTNGGGAFTTLGPRQPLTPTPYALTAANLTGVVMAGSLSGPYSNAVTFDHVANSFTGNGTGLTNVNAATLGGLAANQFWKTGGNAGTTAGAHFVGTTDSQPLVLKVNGLRALRLEDNEDGADAGTTPDGAPNVIGGSPVNFVPVGAVGATISGGGATNWNGVASTNAVLSDYGTVGGGRGNRIESGSDAATIAGGYRNDIGTNAEYSVIGGGDFNSIWDDSPYATIGGGIANDILRNADYSAVGGGSDNSILADSHQATIAGGRLNYIGTNSDSSTIGGGYENNIAANTEAALIAGGDANNIGTNSTYGAIGGGFDNNIADNSWSVTIAGGDHNDVHAFSDYSAVGGGYDNNIGAYTTYAIIAGGDGNDLGTNADFSVISGGDDNTIAANAGWATIAGGYLNDIATNADYSTIGGGYDNNIGTNAAEATIAGGRFNDIGRNSEDSTIGGGYDNRIATDVLYATVGGGTANDIGASASSSTVGGGDNNNIGANSTAATIAGGEANDIGANSPHCAIGGGFDNDIAANSSYATVPGGRGNVATNYAFAAGRRARANHQGAFVWGDSYDGDVTSSTNNQFTVRASGGARFYSNTNLTAGVNLAAGGGSWTSISDRNAKENFVAVNAREILAKVAALPLATWNYKSQPATIRHVGPTAQDFMAAFGVGESDTGITGVDADGVALAAIQGLNQKLEEQARERDVRITALENELAEMKRLLTKLSTKGN